MHPAAWSAWPPVTARSPRGECILKVPCHLGHHGPGEARGSIFSHSTDAEHDGDPVLALRRLRGAVGVIAASYFPESSYSDIGRTGVW